MKWADIDSDSDDEHHHHPIQQQAEPEPEEIEEEIVEEEEPEKEYEWPTEPPFTAYCGNLPFAIKEAQDLDIAIQHILQDRFKAGVTIVSSRLATDRETNKPRGFGYIELETVEDLKTVMRLNDGKSMIKGRPLKLDVAAPPQTNRRPSRSSLNRSNSSGEKVDGSSFRGGRYARRDGSSSSLHRQSSISSDTSEGTRQRLKLAPRSKPLEEKESSQSSLFGPGKARDSGEWERMRSSEPKQQDRRDSASSNTRAGERRGSTSSNVGGERRGSATGGRGRNVSGRGRGKPGANKSGDKSSGRGDGGRGRGGKGGKDDKKKQKPKEADAAPKAVLKVQPVADPPKAATAKVQNKFSALNMDSDSD
jgi:translation initiation factor 4B